MIRLPRRFQFIAWLLAGLLFVLMVPAASARWVPGVTAPSEVRIAVESDPQALVRLGRERYGAGEYAEAAAALERAAAGYRERGDALNRAIALNYLSLTRQRQGRWEDANRAISSSLELIGVPGDGSTAALNRVFASALTTRGQLQLALGQAEAAFETWQRAERAYRTLGDREGEVGSQINQARALEALGLHRRSCNAVLGTFGSENLTCDGLAADEETERERQRDRLLEAISRQPDSELKAMALRSLGNRLRVLGALDLSKQILLASLDVARTARSDGDIALSFVNLGNTDRVLAQRAENYNQNDEVVQNQTEAAIDAYRQAIALTDSPLVKTEAQLNLIHLLTGLNREEDALELFEPVRDRLSALPPGKTTTKARIQLACSFLGCDRVAVRDERTPLAIDRGELLELLETAAERAQQLGDSRTRSYATGTLGTFYEASGDWDTARELTQQALDLAMEAPDLEYQWQWQMGRILQSQREQRMQTRAADPEAIVAYQNAYQTLNDLRFEIAALDPNVQFNFRDRVEPVYRQFIDLLLRGDSPSQKNLQQARQAVEDLQLAELDNFFQDACIERQQVDIEDIDSKAAVLHPIVLKDRLEVIAKFPGSQDLKYFSNPGVDQKRLSGLIEAIRKELDLPGGRTFKIVRLSNTLYNWLISPFEEELKLTEQRQTSTVKNLVFIPDRVLRNLPMSVLYDNHREQYLIERYGISVTPGLQLVKPQREPLNRKDFQILLAGTNEAPSFEEEQLTNLNHVLKEIEEIQKIVQRSTELTEQDFQQQNIESQVTAIPYDIVHLATHGKFSSDPDNTFLLDYNERIKVQNLDRLLRRSERIGLNAIDLLTLSACQTASGDNRAALGLAGVAIRAGSRSTLASLWNVSDVSTALLMQEFYRLLWQTDLTKAEALREAQLKFIYGDLEIFTEGGLTPQMASRPHYWAAFILIGNWL
jgi:CHAT domain-containing protein